jgi:hypothetical protein
MTIETMFEQDADALRVKDNDIEGLAALARRAKELEKEIKDLEAVMKEKSYQFFKLTEESIPEAMTGLGMKSFKLADGSSIEVKAFYSASISAERKAEALNGFVTTALTTSLKTQSAFVLDAAKTSFVRVCWIYSVRKASQPIKPRRWSP